MMRKSIRGRILLAVTLLLLVVAAACGDVVYSGYLSGNTGDSSADG